MHDLPLRPLLKAPLANLQQRSHILGCLSGLEGFPGCQLLEPVCHAGGGHKRRSNSANCSVAWTRN